MLDLCLWALINTMGVLPHHLGYPPDCVEHPAECVDTRRGSDSNRDFSRGNTFPATAQPFAFNMWTPITEPDSMRWLYQYRAKKWLGLAVTHQASPWMGDFGTLHIVPALDVPRASPKARGQIFSHANETAWPHYYAVSLDNGINVALAPTSHAAVIHLDFPSGHTPHVIFDTIRSAWGSLDVQADRGQLQGTLSSRDWSQQERTQYIAARIEDARILSVERLAGRPAGIAVRLNTEDHRPVVIKMATSWISLEQAQDSLEREVGNKTLNDVALEGRSMWDEALKAIEVEGATLSIRQIYINNHYRTLLYPNTLGEGQPSRYRSPYDGGIHPGTMGINNGFWDTYRAVWPLHTLLRPQFTGTMLDGFVQAYKQSGWTPRWSAPGHSAQMVGSHSDAIFADAYVKGVRNFDHETAWLSGLKNATAVSPADAFGRPKNELAQYLGFVPADEVAESASWHLENCVNDFALSRWAEMSQRRDEHAYFGQRAQSYRNLFSPSVGFFRGRNTDGHWRSSDQKFSPIAWGWEFTEGSPWHYIAPAPFDALGTAALYGHHPQALASKIDDMFAAPQGFKEGGYGTVIHEMVEAQHGGMGQYAHPNEPVHHLVWLYNAVGRPELAQKHLREILDPARGFYSLGTGTGGGWLGDEDNGQMSAWYVFAAAGLYPASSGIPQYFIGSPMFSKIVLRQEGGKSFVIVAHNNSDKNIYVQSARLNGEEHERTWLSHKQLTQGGVLELQMGPEPSQWGHDATAWPASHSQTVTGLEPLIDATHHATMACDVAHLADDGSLLTDDDSGTVWHAKASMASFTFALTQSVPVSQYTITCGSDPRRCAPSMWRLEGSDDGQHWQQLDGRDGEFFSFAYQLRPMAIMNPKAYSFFRLTLAAPAAGDCLHVAEIELLTNWRHHDAP